MVAQSRHQLLETGRDWATLWPTWIQSLEAVGILGGGDARYLLGMSRCFFLISWPKFRNTSIKSHKKSSHLHQISSNFSRSSVRWLIFFDWEVEWNIAESILKVAASCWAQPWLVYLPPLQMINLTTFWKWGQTAAWAGIVSGVRSNLRSSAIQCHWCGESRLEISWDILRWELLSRDFLFFETFGTQICGFEHGEIPSVERAMATSCTDISHIGGFLKWDEWGISIHLWWSMTTGWEHDENMMRTWWEHDENWTYAHIFGILRWYPLRLLFTISGYMNVYDLYDMTSCRWVILRGYPHDDWETSKWDQPGTVATGTVWATTLEPADPVVSCGEKNRAGWRWCWVRNKTTLNVKGFDGFLFYYAMHLFPTLPDVLVKWI